ncbi:protein of unknown function DUF450 [Geotalea uraniireducens Rf4]|uniref:type I site-specific deoxyribonuclease n=1 Tax=Geotalea uraniireducens (strain Rf4) TaxID=351605 RepID=A5G9H6_GEOUR|nr:protein of unknown function DUF450 [Geotalea uraniireducens Rf4]
MFAYDTEGFGPESLLGRTSDREVVLRRDVEAALRRLNPGLPDDAYHDALAQVTADDRTKTLLQVNKEKYRLLRDGVPVKYRDEAGRMTDRRLKLVDFDDPANPKKNRFLVVRELWVKGDTYRRRPDVLGYVNGLPLVFIELKRYDQHIDKAFKQNYSDYKDTIPHLFHWNALILLSNGVDAKYGSITSIMEHFSRWKRQKEEDPEPTADQPLLPLLLRGMLNKEALLDLVENFILFDRTEGELQKIVARNHQYLGVNQVIGKLLSKEPGMQAEVEAGRLGVFWHTQGSGKSYSMIFLTEKTHRKISAKYTFVVMTDRNELDEQIFGTYTGCGAATNKKAKAMDGKAPDRFTLIRRAQVEWMKETEICVVVSPEQGEVAEFRKWELDIVPHREKMVHRDLNLEFKKPEHPFRVVIVCAMWLTGYDVKCLATLYLDKPMKGHTLMQAIARVNRVGGGKKNGLIIDYNGMLKSLRKALATFAQGDRKGSDQDILRDDTEAVAEYGQSIRAAQDFLTGCGFNLDELIAANGFDKQAMILRGVNTVCETDERRKTFEVMADDIAARFRGIFPNPGLYAYDEQENAIAAIYNRLQESKESPDVSEMLQALYAVIDTAVTTDTLTVNEPPVRYELTKIDISRLQAEFERTCPNIKMLNLREKIEKRLEAMIARNPTRVDLYERYQEIVAEYNKEYNKDKDAVEVQKVFDLLQKDTQTRPERERIKEVAKELLDKLLSDKLQIDHWREKATAQAQVKAEIIKHLFVNLPETGYAEHEISARADLVFAHLYQTCAGTMAFHQ